MDRAFGANRFVFPVNAFLNPFARVLEQLLALVAPSLAGSVHPAAVDINHFLHCQPFSLQPFSGFIFPFAAHFLHAFILIFVWKNPENLYFFLHKTSDSIWPSTRFPLAPIR